ncbi:MAG TPA: ABC transporter ATP-binding protein [Candidatus Dietzia intestinigallinarum]|nr:ABC transporter ATP-binding protein [Candidatus Dietzia intestinigallinarum]
MLVFDGVGVSVPDRVLLSGVSLEVTENEIVGLVGPNGCGKSTLLRTAYRVRRPDVGRVTWGGRDVWREPVSFIGRHMGVVAQSVAVEFPLTVSEIVLLGRAAGKGLFERDDDEDHARVTECLREVGMLDRRRDEFATLSGGERQRTLIAQALVGEPELLLLDEPTNHLDLHHQVDLMRLLRRRAVTTVVALHDLGLAARYCDRIAVMQDGRLRAVGTPHEVITEEMLTQVYDVDAMVLDHPTDGSPMVVLR